MTQAATQDSAGRGSAESWLQAAYDSLVGSGIDAVRIMPLAKTLQLSRTSFYWFYKDRDALLDALLSLWRDKNTGNLLRRCDAYADTIAEALLNVFDCWLDRELFDSGFEAAIRGWALQSPNVAKEVVAADDARMAALARMFLRHGFDPLGADVRSRTVYLTQLGYLSIRTDEDLETRFSRIPDYVSIFAGIRPTRRELDRFSSRHGASSIVSIK